MSLFRRRNPAPSSVPDAPPRDTDVTGTDQAGTDQPGSDPTAATTGGGASGADPATGFPPAPSRRPGGPVDVEEAGELGDRLDLGSLWLAPVPGLELRIEIDPRSEAVIGLQMVVDESAAQVQAFAAPRSGGLWSEIREELAAAITAAGGSADESEGEFGTELAVSLPQPAPDGQTVFAPARFLGIDGPRWFLRVVLSGRALTEPDAAGPILEAVRGLVVVRGATPMAPRELLPLRLPEQPEKPESDDQGETQSPRVRQPDLNPFERGPEITEVR